MTIRDGWPPFVVWHRRLIIRKNARHIPAALNHIAEQMNTFSEAIQEATSALERLARLFPKEQQ